VHSAHRQAEEDRQSGDRAEEQGLTGAHLVRVTLQTPVSTVVEGMAQGHSVDEYLETIYFLAFPIGEYRPQSTGSPTLASRVAEMLGVSRASAGEMLKRLEAEGLIERGEQKEAILTKTGRARAEKVVRKHRIIERLLTDFMGYTAAEAHVHADELGDTFSDDMVERIEAKLGNPERCPHGWPVDPDFEQAENQELSPLADLEPPANATIVRLAEHDGELLHWFYDEGLVPGTQLELQAAQPAAGQFTVKVDGSEKAIGEKAAAGLFVKPA
jgi:DtxR family transcriptional regulator, Mn-dependent transcriptional regulator